jgi:dTDP-4-dehydrorhamnose reductase
MRWRMNETSFPPLELWGGIECTINRVGDRFVDQLSVIDAYELDAIVDLVRSAGVSKVRWPVLWERVAPRGLASADWSWADRTISSLNEHGIAPIVGLVHHGSGPFDTSLLDPAFPARLAEYARACAERFPSVRHYTPVNEPLTTARFSALYGHWYPHRLDDDAFVLALVNQVRAVIEAMREIRTVQPEAMLVQTEDAGCTTSTPELAAQAVFENSRRWLSLDLLMGRVDDAHPLREYLAAHGFSEAMAAWFCEHRLDADVVGLNYYVTSDRHLDHRTDRYLPPTVGGNGIVRYADVEAARVEGIGLRGHTRVLREAWERYRRPVAITEAHLGCTREEQLRWLRDAWSGSLQARAEGADVRAVTVWALLGSTDWDSLVTRCDGHYEPGPFDVRGAVPRPTALATAAAALAATGKIAHPAAEGPGWWDRQAPAITGRAPLMILGATGTLGRAFAFACERRGLAHVALCHRDLDVLDPDAVREALARHKPWAVINATGYVRVDDAEREIRTCRQVNAVAPAILAMGCRKAGVRLATFSSDLVFDGTRTEPYREEDHVAPLNTYGRSKVEGERRVLALNPQALVIRTSAFFGPWDRANFVTLALDRLRDRQPFRAISDLTVSPTYVPDLVDVSLDLLIDGAEGVWHLANRGAVTWFELAQLAATRAGLDASTLDPCCSNTVPLPAPRPRYSVLGTTRGAYLPPLDDALDRYLVQRARGAAAA